MNHLLNGFADELVKVAWGQSPLQGEIEYGAGEGAKPSTTKKMKPPKKPTPKEGSYTGLPKASSMPKVAQGVGLLHGERRKAPMEHRKLIAAPGLGPAKRLDEYTQSPAGRMLKKRVMAARARPMYPIEGIDYPKRSTPVAAR